MRCLGDGGRTMDISEGDALIFDVDGVLVDTMESFHAATLEVVRRLSGVPAKLEEIVRLKEGSGFNDDVDVAVALLRERGVDVEFERAERLFLEIYEGEPFGTGTCRRERLLVGRKTLEKLSERFRLGVFTGRLRRHMEDAARRFHLHGLFETWVCLEDTPPGKRKPHPYGLLLALARLGVARGAYVGDIPDDMRCAKAAGLVAIGVVPPHAGRRRRKVLLEAGAEIVADSLDQVAEILLFNQNH